MPYIIIKKDVKGEIQNKLRDMDDIAAAAVPCDRTDPRSYTTGTHDEIESHDMRFILDVFRWIEGAIEQ